MPDVEFYYDFRSPFAYFATQRMSLLTDKGAEISWRPVFVDVLLNLQQGQEPWDEPTDPFCPPKRAHFMADIFRLIEFWKIPFQMPSPVKPSANLAMAIAALLEQDEIEHSSFRDAVFRAIWQEQRDASDPAVLRSCLEVADLGRDLIDRAAEKGVDLLTRDTVSAFGRGVFGTPTFVCGDELYFGADRMELIAASL